MREKDEEEMDTDLSVAAPDENSWKKKKMSHENNQRKYLSISFHLSPTGARE